MNRYGIGSESSAEFEPGSRRRVLRNHLGIKLVQEINRMESYLLATAYEDSLVWMDGTFRITSKLICKMHTLWLSDLYPMAGKYRTVDLSKDGFSFCHALYVPQEMARFEADQLAVCSPCTGDLTSVAEKVAIVHAELLMIHPFREGNGRLARWLADLMILQAGYPSPVYELDGKAKQAYFSALRKGYLGDITDLKTLFVSWIERGSQGPLEDQRRKH